MHLTVGFSPCPNDTFIFDAIINNRIDLKGLSFEPVIEDVETLNEMALEGKLDVTKVSSHTLGYILDQYYLLQSGGAMGRGCGPMLITLPETLEAIEKGQTNISHFKVATPGVHTTAHLLLKLAYPDISDTLPMIFSEIEWAIIDEKVDAGVIIHENRFTYESMGLKMIRDLGEFWEEKTSQAIPLGNIVASKRLSSDMVTIIDEIIQASVIKAMSQPEAAMSYVKQYAQAMDEDVMKEHIHLYVNSFTRNLGDSGREAISKFLDYANQLGLVPFSSADLK